MLRKGVTVAVAALLLITGTDALGLQAHSKNLAKSSAFLKFEETEEREETIPRSSSGEDQSLTQEQRELYRNVCGYHIAQLLELGEIEEDEADVLRRHLDRALQALIDSGDIERYHQALEKCYQQQDEHSGNRH
ncbi:UNKNOWN [Stylonychia lemnae]|uniref:Uncharacterized protein n=1 Tax=Stylonychia lemnae TaxID=5949 RepID=A0A078A3C7_STYLE|nr:UNKNOWN [Stylonychia lemnae]|eukprot:CDW76013.1 UNKNOWN [Stylonychia lemnae]